MKLKERRQHIFKCDEPDLQESAIFKKIVAYQRKLLVCHISHGFSQFVTVFNIFMLKALIF